MARIFNFIFCMGSDVFEGVTNAHGILTALTPDYLPGAFSFSAICSIINLEDGDHKISFRFEDPSGCDVAALEGIISFEADKASNLPKEYMGICVNTNWQNVVFKQSGLYKMFVVFDKVELGSYEIYVKGKNEVDNA